MKKVIGLCLVVLLSSTSVFARENRRMDKRKMDPSARCEKMIADLKLHEAMKAEREKQREKMLAMREDKNAQMKKILTEEQYKQYLEKQQPKGNKHGRKHLGNGRR